MSERDIVCRAVAARRDAETTTVGQISTRDVITIDVNQPLKTVLGIFRAGKFRHLPVVRDGKPIGILSARDFYGSLVEGFERYVSQQTYNRPSPRTSIRTTTSAANTIVEWCGGCGFSAPIREAITSTSTA